MKEGQQGGSCNNLTMDGWSWQGKTFWKCLCGYPPPPWPQEQSYGENDAVLYELLQALPFIYLYYYVCFGHKLVLGHKGLTTKAAFSAFALPQFPLLPSPSSPTP